MDKQEYKILSEEIMTLVANEEFIQAAEIADRIDWRKVRSFSMLQKISDLYKINRRFEEALEILQLAYDRNPNSRTIVYSMCELYLELNDLVSALQYLALYKKMAPYDTGVYILQYKIKEFAEAPIEERIELLEELNRKDYREEWAYQLAYLYHRIGFATKCIEACDQLITWFGEGPFVIKAMELKMLHTKLTPKQQELYDHRNDIAEEIEAYESDEYVAEKPEPGVMPELGDDEDFHVKTIDMSKFNTINLQKALADSMRELMGEDESSETKEITQKLMQPMMDTDPLLNTDAILNGDDGAEALEDGPVMNDEYYGDEAYEGDESYSEEYSEEEQYEYTEDVEYEDEAMYDENGEYIGEDGYYEEDGQYDETTEEYTSDEQLEDVEYTESEPADEEIEEEYVEEVDITSDESSTIDNSEVYFEDKTSDIVADTAAIKGLDISQIVNAAAAGAIAANEAAKGGHYYDEKSGFEDILSLDIDGQISLAIPKDNQIEKQITGQMDLDDVLNEWEKIKARKEQQQHDEIKQSIMDRTGQLFTAYDTGMKNGILSQLEEAERVNKMIIRNDLELKKADDLQFVDSVEESEEKPFDATAALNKEYDSSIWAEVDAAIAADQMLNSIEDAAKEAAMDGVEAIAEGAEAIADEASEIVDDKATGEELTEDAENTELTEEYSDEYAEEYPEEEYIEGEYIPEDEALYEEEYEGEYDESEYEGEYADEEYYEEYEGEYEEGYEPEYEEEYVEEEIPSEDVVEDVAEDIPEETSAEEVVPEEPSVASESAEEQVVSEETTEEAPEAGLNTSEIGSIGDALEAAADKEAVDTIEEMNDDYQPQEDRDFSNDELELFSDFLYSKRMRKQILEAVNLVSLDSYVGNVIITGDKGTGGLELAKSMIKELQLIDGNFSSSKVAKISGSKMNKKDVPSLFMQLAGGALIIEKAGAMTKDALENITMALENAENGILVVLLDNKKAIDSLFAKYDVAEGYFNARIDIIPMNDKALVEYAKKYAYSKEFKIDDEKGVLALHQRINELQIGEHIVTTQEIEDIVDDAIDHAKRPRLSNIFKVIAGKRYDHEDMIILQESDFE